MYNTKKIALSGILLAFTVISLFLASILPTNRLSFYALSSVFVSIIIMEFQIKSGWVFYAASCLLSLLLIRWTALLPYLVFFGPYGIAKFYIEKLNRLIPEYIIKFVYFNLSLLAAFILIKELFIGSIPEQFPWWLIIIGLQAAFFAYDYAYTLFIRYYREKLKKIFRV